MNKKALGLRFSRIRPTLVLLAAVILSGAASAQTLTTITGTIKDLAQTIVSTGKVVFTLMPGIDTTISGTAIFPSSQTTCTINQSTAFTGSGLSRKSGLSIVTVTFTASHTFVVGDVITVSVMTDPSFNGTFTVATVPNASSITYSQSGATATTGGGVIAALRKVPGPGSCGLTFNTAISPSGTYYNACIWPEYVKSSCFNMYAVSPALDITTVVPTPATAPAYNFLDSFSNQSIAGNKTFTGTTSANGNFAGTFLMNSYNFSSLPSVSAPGQGAYLTDKWRGLVVYNGIRWRPITGAVVHLSDFAKGDMAALTGCSTTSGSYVLTCAGPFTAADVGKLIVIYGAKANGSGASATTTLAAGAITAPTVTAGGTLYVNAPAATVTGLTCTVGQPEIIPVLTGAAVSSITITYAGSGCTGTPVIAFAVNPALAWQGVISVFTNSTTVTTTSDMGAPSISNSPLSGLYGTDDGVAINAAINSLATAADARLNPVTIFCDHAYMYSGTLSFINKSVKWMGIPGGNLAFGSTTTPQEGCLLMSMGGAATDAMYIAGNVFSDFNGIHIEGVNGNKGRAAIRLQQPSSGNGSQHNNQYNHFSNITVGPTYVGEPNILGYPNGDFKYGIFTDQPSANNDQMIFDSTYIWGVDTGIYNRSNQSTELVFNGLRINGVGICAVWNATIQIDTSDCSNAAKTDWLIGDDLTIGDPSPPAGNAVVNMTNVTSEGGHQFMRHGSTATVFSIHMHGQISVQPSDTWIRSGTQIDFGVATGGGAGEFLSDNDIAFTPGTCTPCAPLNYVLGSGGADKREFVVAGHATLYNGLSTALSFQSMVASNNYAPQHYVRKFFDTGYFADGQEVQTEMVLNKGTDLTAEPNHRDLLGKVHVMGALQVDKLYLPAGTNCQVGVGGGGATNYYYKLTALANGKESLPSAEITCTGAAALNSTNKMTVCMNPVVGAQQYRLYGRTAMGAEGLIKTFYSDDTTNWSTNFPGGINNLSCTMDDGAGAPGAAPPTVDGTGSISAGGKIINYNGMATAGNGIPAIVGVLSLTGLVADHAAVNLVPAAPAGDYRVCFSGRTTTAGVGPTEDIFLSWTDETGVHADNTGLDLTQLGAFAFTLCDLIHANAGTNIQIYSNIRAGGSYGAAVYALQAVAERLQ